MGKKITTGKCELCLREDVELTEHHLTPKEMGGTFLPTSLLCIPCHKQIHALYSNEELALSLNTIQVLQSDKGLSKFIRWIRKQPSGKLPRITKSKERKRKGRK
ncbi:hypothetical protein [Peribacillus acanthi]|uniref:hypothetical protein n=1 Tax=Peribacillus acanthi TaxID=2171554 RepID=UPI000D3EBB81|nr:hypothetical protein [Peribacillus acanthi]